MRFRVLIAILIISMSSVALALQQSDQIVALKTDGGALLVWNQPGQHFTVELRGETSQPLTGNEHVFFKVDGVIVQIGAVAVKEFAEDRRRNGSAILAAHRDWEVKSIVERLGAPVAIRSSEVDLGRFGKGLLWDYDMPAGPGVEAKQQLYLTVLSQQLVVYFNGVATDTVSEDRVKQLLMTTASSLQVKNAHIDIGKLQKRLRAR